MKKLLLTFFSLLSLACFSQITPVSVDLGFSDAHLEDGSGNLIDANAISLNQLIKVKVNVINFSETDAAPGGHFRIRIGLGAGLVLNNPGAVTSAPLNTYFDWSYDLSGAQPQIVGLSKVALPLPADFFGTAEFELKAATTNTSTVSYNLLISNPQGTTTPLSDPAPSNNVAANSYTVANALTFTTTKSNVSCFGAANGSLIIAATGGITPYGYTIVNTVTNVSSSNNNGTFANLAPATYTITVMDAGSNTATGSTIISQPAAVAVSATATNVSCNGLADGTITVSGLSGGASYTVKKDGTGPNLSSNASFGPGSYTIEASAPDGNNVGVCTKQVIVQITEPPAVILSATATNVSCNGSGNGTITASATGGATIKINGNTYNSAATYGPGTYTVTASAPNGNGNGVCTASTQVTITEPTALSFSVSSTNVSCFGAADGTISVTTNGSYVIKDAMNNTVTGQSLFAPGAYTITATKAGGNAGQTCTTQTTVTINQPTQITLSATKTNVSCNGAADGTIIVNTTGATMVTVNGSAYNAAAAYGPGTYTIVGSAAGGNNGQTCSKQIIVNITQPDAVTLSAAKTNVSCSGAGDGTITVVTNGTYVIKNASNNDVTAQTIFGPGTYTVTAKLPNGNNNGFCTSSTQITITEPPAVNVSATATNVSCFGASDGTVAVNASAGATVTVNGSAYSPSAAYGPGTYTVVASATNGNNNGQCTATTIVTVSQPAEVTLSATSTNVSCNGAADGTITASATGGATVTVNGNLYNATATYGPGTYTITATAPGGNTGQTCNKQTIVTITQPALLTLLVTKTNVTCNGAANGTISVATNGTYVIKDASNNDVTAQTVFAPGTYTVTATKAGGNAGQTCSASTQTTIMQPNVLTNSFVSKINNACNGGTTGQITVNAAGGTQNYTYAITTGPAVNNSGVLNGIFTGLAASTYSITVTDANQCTAVVSGIVLSQPTSTLPDVTVSAADYTDNFFQASGSEITLIYQVTEVGGNAAINDSLWITRQSSYAYTLITTPSVNVGGTVYPLDNSRWSVDNSTPAQPLYKLVLNAGEKIGCGESKYIGIKLQRNTVNKSVFTLTGTVRPVAKDGNPATKETNLTNNATTVVLVGQ